MKVRLDHDAKFEVPRQVYVKDVHKNLLLGTE